MEIRRGRWVMAAAGLALALAAGSAGAGEGDQAGAPPTGTPDPRIEELKGRLDALNDQVQILQNDTDRIRKLKWSGYLQARYEINQASRDSVKVADFPNAVTPANTDRFFIRRARLKLTYDPLDLTQMVFYIDGGTDRTIRLLEGYVTLLDPWTPLHRHQLTIGQMNVPFGWEIERSSSVRELPERSRAENVLFSGERDRGIKLVDRWTDRLETVVGLLNGGGINNPDFPNTDPTRMKDFVGRARYSRGDVDGAVSIYLGKNVVPLTGPDVETDKRRFGADLQTFYQVPRLGGGSLRGEFYAGTEVNPDSVKALVSRPTASSPGRVLKPHADPGHLATDFRGWYVMWVQNLGDKWQAAARYDTYDPDTNVDHDQFRRLGFGVNYFYDTMTRITLACDVPKTDAPQGGGRTSDPRDSFWTIQVQFKY